MTNAKPRKISRKLQELQQELRETQAKSEVFHFRLDTDLHQALFDVAAKKRKAVGALVREWVQERIRQELGSPPGSVESRLRRLEEACESHGILPADADAAGR